MISAMVSRWLAASHFKKKQPGIFWGPNSMVPQLEDFKNFFRHFRWFLGLGPRPQFGRFTYWEKFDYWAVFWGVSIIGTSGLFLWFPTFFAQYFPGWIFNVAFIVHSDEGFWPQDSSSPSIFLIPICGRPNFLWTT